METSNLEVGEYRIDAYTNKRVKVDHLDTDIAMCEYKDEEGLYHYGPYKYTQLLPDGMYAKKVLIQHDTIIAVKCQSSLIDTPPEIEIVINDKHPIDNAYEMLNSSISPDESIDKEAANYSISFIKHHTIKGLYIIISTACITYTVLSIFRWLFS